MSSVTAFALLAACSSGGSGGANDSGPVALGPPPPATGQETPATGQETPATGQETPATGQETPDCVDANAIEGGGAPKRFSAVVRKVRAADVDVDNLLFTTTGATVYVDGNSVSPERLRVGDAVTVTGELDLQANTGCAAAIFSDADITAVIDATDLAPGSQTIQGSLTVLGQRVLIDSSTVLGDDVLLSGESALQVGDRIRVSGVQAVDSAVMATRIDRADGEEGYFVTGVVTDIDAQGQTFRINRFTVRYGEALLIYFPAGVPRDDDTVRLTGTVFEAGDSGATVIQPTRIEYIEYGTPVAVEPKSASLWHRESMQFRASGAVTWSVSRNDGGECDPEACGVIDSTGKFTPSDTHWESAFETLGLRITATSVADPRNTATATVYVLFVPPPQFGPHTLTGEVFSSETGPIGGAGAYIWVAERVTGHGYGYTSAHDITPFSDDLGRFQAPDLPDSRVSVLTGKQGYVQPCAVTPTVIGDQSVRVELMPVSAFDTAHAPRPQMAAEPSVTGQIFEITATGRQPVAGATVWLEEFGPIYARTISDRSGGYYVCNLGDLVYARAWLSVRKDGYEMVSSGDLGIVTGSRVVDIELKRL
jgi:hypothetical protein